MILIQQALCRFFPAREIVTLEAISGATTNAWVAEVTTETGQERWFVKRHTIDVPGRLQAQLRLIQTTSQGGCRLIPPMVPSRAGELVVIIDGESYSVQTFVDADNVSALTTQKVRGAAAALAKFHDATAKHRVVLGDFKSAPYLTDLLPSIDLKWHRALSEGMETLGQDDPVRSFIRTHQKMLMQDVSKISAWGEHGRSSNTNWPVIHGDFHPRNVLYRGDDVVAIVDYDFIHTAALGCDVGYALYMFGRTAPGQFNFDLMDEFLDAYNQASTDPYNRSPHTRMTYNMMRWFVAYAPIVAGWWWVDRYVDDKAARDSIRQETLDTLLDAKVMIETGGAKM